MYGSAVADRVRCVRYRGEIPDAVELRGTNPVCGDILTLFLQIEDGIIRDAAWKAQGCPPTLAAADVLVELIKGQSVKQAIELSADSIAEKLPGLPRTSFHAIQLALQVLGDCPDG